MLEYSEWDEEKDEFEALMKEIMGTKSRTLKSYSLIGMAVKYIYNANEETFLELGHPWEEMLQEFLPGRFKEAVRLTHPDISRPDLLFKNFLLDLGKYARELTISQVGHNLHLLSHLHVNSFVTNITCTFLLCSFKYVGYVDYFATDGT